MRISIRTERLAVMFTSARFSLMAHQMTAHSLPEAVAAAAAAASTATARTFGVHISFKEHAGLVVTIDSSTTPSLREFSLHPPPLHRENPFRSATTPLSQETAGNHGSIPHASSRIRPTARPAAANTIGSLIIHHQTTTTTLIGGVCVLSCQ